MFPNFDEDFNTQRNSGSNEVVAGDGQRYSFLYQYSVVTCEVVALEFARNWVLGQEWRLQQETCRTTGEEGPIKM